MNSRHSAITSLLVILVVSAVALSAVGMTYAAALDRHFGYGKPVVDAVQVSAGDAQYYDVRFTQDIGEQGTLAYANRVTRQITDEGTVLMKNNGILPLKEQTTVTPLGYRFLAPVYGGTGSGRTNVNEGLVFTPFDGLAMHFAMNEASIQAMKKAELLKISAEGIAKALPTEASESSAEVYEYPVSVYQGLENTCEGTVGVVFIGRIGGESANYSSAPLADGTPHVLALTQAEKDIIGFSKQHCHATLAIINSSNVMEIGELMAGPLECDAILWVGGPGNTGFRSLGDILAGRVNPSGRTPDLWDADLLANPTQKNFCDIRYENTEGISFSSNYDGSNAPAGLYYIEYEEGIYVGYRYYETADALGMLNYGKIDETGRKITQGAVNYPFGYGLSYTTFAQKIQGIAYDPVFDRGDVVVQVSNLGDMDGMEVIQLYSQSPYTDFDRKMGIEKAVKNLIAFDKVAVPCGETRQVTLSFLREELASYCMTRKNPDGTEGCYCLEEGEYRILLGQNSHISWDEVSLTVGETVYYDASNPRQSERSAQKAEMVQAAVNRFEHVTDYMRQDDVTNLTRADWANTMPTPPSSKVLNSEQLSLVLSYDPYTDTRTGNEGIFAPHVSTVISGAKNGLKLSDLRGKDDDDPLWDLYLDQIDYREEALWNLMLSSSMHTAAVEAIGKPLSTDWDGPQGLHSSRNKQWSTYAYSTEVTLAATFNVNLAYAFGESIGNEALLIGLTGWYGPGLNIHRNAFCGRNFEYYSEDALLSGKMGAACISGAAACGVICYMKHFAMNNYEGPATCLAVWATEQTIRETYLRSFEIAVKEATAPLRYYNSANDTMTVKTIRASLGMMGAANRIGLDWCAANYPLLQQVLRGEWGFQGAVTTDMALQTVPGIVDQVFRSGGDLRMYYYGAVLLDTQSPVALYQFRRAVKNISYAYANSNLMQGIAPGAFVTYTISPWRIVIIVFDVLVAMAVLGYSGYRIYRKRKADRLFAR